MRNINYRLSGFKCFLENSFELKNVTILTGSNGTGKSSFIQALLLIRSAIEKNCAEFNGSDFTNTDWARFPIPLNGPYLLNLGSIFEIFNANKKIDNSIHFELDGERFEIELPSEVAHDDRATINLKTAYSNNEVPFWRKREFYYLHTERLGPRLGINAEYTEFPHCNFRGENTAEIIAKWGTSKKINDQRSFQQVKSLNLDQQVDAWLSQICPGTLGVQVKQHDFNRYQITMRTNASKSSILAPNIGFGISYSLPIIVNGLIAEKGSVFIVENPEAHLHPKGQSNMGFFLGMVAASGVRVIIETHSEHIVNGVRRASLYGDSLLPENVGIYFFEDPTTNPNDVKKVVINKSGDLESFPKDFFDQAGQDLAELYKLKTRFKNG